MFSAALLAAAFGWVTLLLMVVLEVGTDPACGANQGDAFQECVRSAHDQALTGQALALCLGTIGLVISLASSIDRGFAVLRTPEALIALILSGLLFAVSMVGWVLGPQGLWAPDLPYPYDPIATSDGHAFMIAGTVGGLVVGAVVVLAVASSRKSSRRGSSGET